MAICRHISTKLVLVLDAETAGGKKRKRVTVSNIRKGVSADVLLELAAALDKVLAHPVARVLLYTEETLEREDGDAPKTGGVREAVGADLARAEDVPALAALAPRVSALSGETAGAGVYRKQATRRGQHTRLPPRLPETEAVNGRPPPPTGKKGRSEAALFRRIRHHYGSQQQSSHYNQPGCILDCHVAYAPRKDKLGVSVPGYVAVTALNAACPLLFVFSS